MAQIHQKVLHQEALIAEMKALSTNGVIISTQADRHITNLMARWMETEVLGAPVTKPIATHNE